jgi:F-type H+-transporting ATPase subunit gamma
LDLSQKERTVQTIEALQRKIKSAEDLLSVVKTMKALAAVSIRQYERAVVALTSYHQTVEMGLQIVLRAQPGERLIAPLTTTPAPADGPLGVIVFGSDQGLCGQFNERIVTHAVDALNGMHIRKQHRHIAAVGARCAALLDEAAQPVSTVFNVPSGLAGITHLVQDLLLFIDDWRTDRQIARMVLFHNRPLGNAAYQPQRTQLLPLDLAWLHRLQTREWPSRTLPTFSMEAPPLFSTLIRQHMFVVLHCSCTESLASEEASRLAAMQQAERNIEERLNELHAHYHQQRQSAITTELLDIIAGYAAVTAQ